jgi:hypothetical protein
MNWQRLQQLVDFGFVFRLLFYEFYNYWLFGESIGLVVWQINNLLQHYNKGKFISPNFYFIVLFLGLRCLCLSMSLFLMFKFQISMVKECNFVENVGRIDEDFPSNTPT